MSQHVVSIVRYEEPGASVRKAVELCGGLDKMPLGATVFIKPNIVFWSKSEPFPKWGMITTSRVVEDMAAILKDAGAGRILIGEGSVRSSPTYDRTMSQAYESLGYNRLAQRYGVETVDIWARPFKEVDLGGGVTLNFNRDILESDFVVDLPVMKTHAQTVVSFGIKNLKGTIDVKSRKRCHSADPDKDLHYMVSRLADKMPPMFTLVDGIYTTERGPSFDGRVHRSNLLAASSDVLSVDLVSTRILGRDPEEVGYLKHAAANRGRPMDLSDVKVAGERIEDVARVHEYAFPYNEAGTLPAPMEKMGIKGLSYREYDTSLCTYCSGINGVVLSAVAQAWKGEPWEGVEVLTGKVMEPTPGMKKTILLGKCMYQAHKDNPAIKEALAVKGCPPKPEQIIKALHGAGIMVEPAFFAALDSIPPFFMKRYKGKPEYDEAHFQVAE